ncbi:MAG: DUF2147 domain-containing protein [Hyphomicrobiaceae bacterium]|nr:DUF2147 domain-containing protein [Hyphomicrobiaceae bacterium]
MHACNRLLGTAAAAAVLLSAASASASPDPRGVWIDHTGRGAVEITDCGAALCGRVVWLKDAGNEKACGIQILGNVKAAGTGIWDNGWIYDPEQDSKFSVELKPMGPEKLRVLGYLGTKLFSETMYWKRAPVDLQRCGAKQTTAALTPPASPVAAPPPVKTGPTPPPAPTATTDGEAAAAPAAPSDAAAAEGQSTPEPGKPAQTKAKPQECKVQTPWLSFSFPCPE